MDFRAIRLFIKLSRPLFLLGAGLVYALGVGIAHFLGSEIDWGLYLLGQAWVTTLQLATHYFNEYFDSPADIMAVEFSGLAMLTGACANGAARVSDQSQDGQPISGKCM